MTVKEVFDLRKQGRIEEAYEAIRPMYAVHQEGRGTGTCPELKNQRLACLFPHLSQQWEDGSNGCINKNAVLAIAA
jgi:hypothetical protein